MRVLITGFEPQFGIKKTPSGELAKLWQSQLISVPGVDVDAIVLPQIFGMASEITCSKIMEFSPDVVLMYGATQHNSPVRLERFAVNVRDSPMGDNSMIPVIDQSIVNGGPAAYETTLPVLELSEAMKAEGVNTIVSYHAGTHVCNDQMYLVLRWLQEKGLSQKVAAGFIHISFPNEFGVVEDRGWKTAGFDGIVDSSIKLVRILSERLKYSTEET